MAVSAMVKSTLEWCNYGPTFGSNARVDFLPENAIRPARSGILVHALLLFN